MRFSQRGQRRKSGISDSMRWRSECGRYTVARMRPILNGDRKEYYLALENPPGEGEKILGRHYSRDAAEATCIVAAGPQGEEDDSD